MTPAQRFTFDVQGYLVLEGALAPDRVRRMVAEMERRQITDAHDSGFGGFLEWGPDWHGLIDEPALMPLLTEMLGKSFRLDHAYGMAMSHTSTRGGEGLHHHAGMFDHGCFYATHGQQMRSGLLVVSYALTDIAPGAGGFCCIPGSHKASFPMPQEWFKLTEHPMIRHIPMKAGDALIFTEALSHGTLRWTDTRTERRSVLMKYCPGYMRWAAKVVKVENPALTPRQRIILGDANVEVRPAQVDEVK